MTRLVWAAAVAMLVVAPADAKVLKTGPVKIDPKQGYVLARIGPTNGKRFKTPQLYLWRFDPASSDIRTTRKSDLARVPKGENSGVGLGDRVFTPGITTSMFVAAITPGDWVVHGTESTCLCLGSYRFTVTAGEVTDIGSIFIAREDGSGQLPELSAERLSSDLLDRPFAVSDAVVVRPAVEGDAVPPELAGLKITRAVLVPDVRFPNRGPTRMLYPGGLLVNRATGLPAPQSGDMKALVERIAAAADQDGLTVKPVLEKDKPADGK